MTETSQGETATPRRSSVRRTAQVMSAFTTQSRWGVRELAGHLEIPKSGLHRTLQELATESLLVADDDGTYELGGDMLRLAGGLLQTASLPRAARPHIRRARDVTSESVFLVAYDDGRQQIVAVDTVMSPHPIQFLWSALSEWTDLHLSASGLGVLAALPPEDLERYFSVPRVDGEGNALNLAAFTPVLEEVRSRGWAMTRSQRIAGSTGVSAAVRDGRGDVRGAVVIAWPDRGGSAADADSIGRAAAEAASKTSAALGWS
ncbi:IclR family transcriptional regulator [Agrococcus baldri]|uniref:Transcriptional regulator n=1 Tax=Agrococcus baldri TaxID=153730 RepID=A0AA87RJ42_9MICO|nr:IclR family transcriptional regulator [Agrococcus baldri]GEK79137.1 transcriptional regulator [Agrococcus baldri]